MTGGEAHTGTIVVRDGRIVYASDGVVALAGRPVEEILGRPVAELVVPEEREIVESRGLRRRRGEPAPTRYEVNLAHPGGGRRLVEIDVQEDGGDLLVHVRDLSARRERRLRLEAVAALGAAIQHERSEEAIRSRVEEGLRDLGVSSIVVAADPDALRVVRASVPPAFATGFLAAAGAPLHGYAGAWSDFFRRIQRDGAAFTEELALEVARAAPDPLAAELQRLANATGMSCGAGVRIEARDRSERFLVLAGDWLVPDDLPAVRLFGAQVGAALAAARIISDLSRRNAELDALNRIAALAGEETDFQELIARTSGILHASLGSAGLALFVLDEPAGALDLVYADGGPSELRARYARISTGDPLGEVLRTRVPRAVPTPATGPAAVLAAHGVRSLALVPLVSRSRPVGVLAVGFGDGEGQVRDRLDLLTALCAHFAGAIESHALFADLRQRVEDLSLLNEMARAVAASLDVDDVLDAGVEAARRLLDVERGFVALYDPVRAELRVGAAVGFHDFSAPPAVPLEEAGLLGEVIRERRPLLVEEAEGDPRIHDEYRRRFHPRAILAAPLLVRGEPLGAILVDDTRGPRRFTAAEVDRVSVVASHLAIAVENARLYAEARRRAEQVGLLHEVGRSLVATLDIRDVLERGVENLARIVESPCASLALVSEDGAHAEICAVSGPHASHLGMRLPLEPPESSLAALVFSRREPVLVEDAAVDPRVNSRLRADTGARGYLGLPLIVRDRTIGVVVIMDPRGPRRFTPAEVERAAAIANQLAVAVENARLYEDLRKSYAELARAQEQLIQRERLAALGEISAVVAHEVRNPLGVIFNSLGSLRRLVRPTGDAKMLLDIVGEEAERLNRIVGDLLDFARPSTPELRPAALDRVVDDAIGAALSQNLAAVEVSREFEADLPPVPLDARLVRQAVLNVAVNAVQAMPRGGRLAVRVRREPGSALVEIEDTGAGIPDEVKARIFEPFFTTKASGTGLGLAVVKRIVDGHRGGVAVTSRAGGGTVFALRFPLAAADDVENPAAMR